MKLVQALVRRRKVNVAQALDEDILVPRDATPGREQSTWVEHHIFGPDVQPDVPTPDVPALVCE